MRLFGKTFSGRAGERLATYMLLGATVGVMIATVWPSLNDSGYLAAWDAGGHLLKARYLAEHLLPLGFLTGWFPTWHGGFDLLQFYPPLLYYILGPLTYIFKPELALRLLTAGLWIGLVPVTYYFLRSFSMRRLSAALGTSLLLALNASFGIGLGALYGVGLLPNGLGFILAIWALGRLKRDLTNSARGTVQLVLTGLVVGLLILAHTFSAYWWVAASVILLGSELIGRPDKTTLLKRYGLVLGTGLLISAYWWLPLAMTIGHMGLTGNIQQSSRGAILQGLLLADDRGGIPMALLSVAGLVYIGLRRQFRMLGFFLALGVFSLLLSINTINGFLPFGAVISSSQFIRFHAFFAWLMMVWAAFGLAGLWYFARRLRFGRQWLLGPIAMAAATALFLALMVIPTLQEKRGFIRVVDNEPTAELQDLAGYLDGHLRPGEFILSEFNWDARYFFGSPHFVNQRLPMLSQKIWDLDGNFPEGTLGADRPVLIASVLDNSSYLNMQQEYLRSRGVRYIVSTHPNSRTSLDLQPWLKPVWEGKVLSVYELQRFDSSFGLPPLAASKLKDVTFNAPGQYHLTFREPIELPARTALALSEHPWLVVTADGHVVASTQDVEHRLTLMQGTGQVSAIDITYRPPLLARAAKTVSVVSLFGVVLLLARRRWAKAAFGVVKRRVRRTRRPQA